LDSCGEDHPMFRPSRARGALLLVAFSVLASTATAHAECAWVMWKHVWRDHSGWRAWWPASGDHWTITEATTTREECEKAADGSATRYFKLGELLAKSNPSALDLSEHTVWICLPDTVDPREPKG